MGQGKENELWKIRLKNRFSSIKMATGKNYRFYNLPKKYGMQDYREVTETIIKKYSSCNDLVSIYNWGDPSTPGISDIDILFVFKDGAAQPLSFFIRSFNFLDARARYLIRHPFVFIGEESFKNIRYVYPNADFKLLYGKRIRINPLTAEEICHSKISLLNDIIIRHYPRDFLEQNVNRRINARDVLLRLNSLKYTAGMIAELAKNENRQWSQKLNQVYGLRKNWFWNNDFGLLASLTDGAVNISMEIIESFRLFLVKNNIVKIYSGAGIRYDGIKNKSLFVKDWNKEDALQQMRELIKSKKIVYSVLPIELSAQLAQYSKHQGRISGYIESKLSADMAFQLKHKNAVLHRAEIFNNQAELAFNLRHSDFAAFFDFGYRNKSGINNWVIGLADRFRF